MDKIRFDGRVAIVTGAGNGMGKHYALSLASLGASVVVNDLGGSPDGVGGSRNSADAVVDEIKRNGGQAVASYDSVATQEGGLGITRTAVEAFGKVDILINNAGIMRTGLLANLQKGDLDALLATHLYGGFFVTQPAFKEMKKNRYGRIVFVSSNGGAFGISGYSAYNAAKAGLIGLMTTVALEGARHGILSNVLLPGALTRLGDAASKSAATELGATSEDTENQDNAEMAAAFGIIQKAMGAEFVTPMALYLTSERCKATQSIFSAVAGRYARAFMGLSSGWLAPDDVAPQADDIEAHFGEIQDLGHYSVPRGVADEYVGVAKARQAGKSQA